MKRYLISLVLALGVLGLQATPVAAVDVDPNGAVVTSETNGEDDTKQDEAKEIAPTFQLEEDRSKEKAMLRFGSNLMLMGNNVSSTEKNSAGMLLAFGNNLALGTKSDYGFIAGNTINYSGETDKDLYIAGNSITLSQNAKIGRDVFIAGNTLVVETDLEGDLSFAGASVVIKDVKISGNVNLDAGRVRFEGQPQIGGELVYNDTADIDGINVVKIAGETTIYHDEDFDEPDFSGIVFGKIFSVLSLALVMLIICALFPRLHDKVEQESTTARFGIDLAAGLAVLVGVPAVALFLVCTLIGAPLALLLVGAYIIMIYLSQGFAGAWLGHVIIEKLCKMNGNIFVETIVGVILLGALALVPWIGAITGVLGMLLGLGIMVTSLKPMKQNKAKAKSRTQKKVQK